MKKFEILWELPKWDPETQCEQMLLEKWHLQTCPTQGCHKPSVCKIYTMSVKYKKTNSTGPGAVVIHAYWSSGNEREK